MGRYTWPAALVLIAACAGQAVAAVAPQVPGPPAAPSAPATGKTYVLEAIRTGAVSADLKSKLAPLHTLADVEALLKQNRIQFMWRITEMQASAISPEMIKMIESLPPHEVFIAPQTEGLVIAVVLETR